MKMFVLVLPASLLVACGAKNEAGQNGAAPPPVVAGPSAPVNDSQPAGGVSVPMHVRTWGETDTARLRRLNGDEIRVALLGKMVSYEPPRTADAGANEVYLADGTWRGMRFSRAVLDFSGRWQIVDDRLCTTAERGLVVPRHVCRELWRDPRTGALLMEHMMGAGRGLLRLTIRPA